MKRIVVGMFLLSLALPGLAQTEKLGVGDAIRVLVHQQPDLTTEARISERGMVVMPLIGEVKIAGLSQVEAARAIGESLKKGQFLKNPQVSVAVTTVRSKQVSVLGQVARPGRYALDDTSSKLADVVAAAGGITAVGDDKVTVMRDGKEHKVALLGKPFELKGGETINVERAPVFYIYGEVSRAGAYRIEPNMTVMQAIAAGGGITPRGSDRRLKLRRAGADGKLVEKDATLRDLVNPDDVIYVKEALF
ncbi:MAG TPA: polysaccharide export protein EpsE [Burkholderiales bacterium]|nr:polysaccharide export protein EpsE [Burkholderiales bacterium]